MHRTRMPLRTGKGISPQVRLSFSTTLNLDSCSLPMFHSKSKSAMFQLAWYHLLFLKTQFSGYNVTPLYNYIPKVIRFWYLKSIHFKILSTAHLLPLKFSASFIWKTNLPALGYSTFCLHIENCAPQKVLSEVVDFLTSSLRLCCLHKSSRSTGSNQCITYNWSWLYSFYLTPHASAVASWHFASVHDST